MAQTILDEDGLCRIGGVVPDYCAHCRGHKETKPTDGLLIERFKMASYDGFCKVEKGHRIKVGDKIGLAVNENDMHGDPVGWICENCVEAITE